MKIDIPGAMKDVDRLTATTPSQRAALLKYSGKLSDELLIIAMQRSDSFYYENRSRHQHLGKAQLQYCGFIRAIKQFKYSDTVAIHRKCDDVASIEEVHAARLNAAMLQRIKPKKSAGLEYYLPELLQYKKEGYSLRDMVEYLKGCNITVSHETIRRKLYEVRNNQQDKPIEYA